MTEEKKLDAIKGKEDTRALNKDSKEILKKIEGTEKEFLEAVEALKKIAFFAGKVSKDGKVDAKDLPALIDLAKEFDVILEGVKDIDKAIPSAMSRRFAFLSLESILAIFDEFKKGKK